MDNWALSEAQAKLSANTAKKSQAPRGYLDGSIVGGWRNHARKRQTGHVTAGGVGRNF